MKKFSRASKYFTYSEILLLCFVLGSKTVFSQPEEKSSIQNKILQEKPPAFVAYSALAPESIFLNAEAIDAFYKQAKQTKSLTRILAGQEVEELQKELNQIQEGIIVPQQQRMASAQARNIPKRFFSQVTKKNIPLQLIHHNDLQGTINTLPYERIKGRGIRFRYTKIPEQIIGHFWHFKQSHDLRGKNIRIYYSGIVPNEVSFLLFRSYWSVKAIYNIHLEDSEETKTITFQIPNRLPFKDVSICELRIQRAQAGKPYGDFLIEKVEVVKSNDHSTSIKTDNESKPFVFGGPYLQSNVWGGEVLAS